MYGIGKVRNTVKVCYMVKKSAYEKRPLAGIDYQMQIMRIIMISKECERLDRFLDGQTKFKQLKLFL